MEAKIGKRQFLFYDLDGRKEIVRHGADTKFSYIYLFGERSWNLDKLWRDMFVSLLLFSVSLENVQSPLKRTTSVQCFFSAKSKFVCHLYF